MYLPCLWLLPILFLCLDLTHCTCPETWSHTWLTSFLPPLFVRATQTRYLSYKCNDVPRYWGWQRLPKPLSLLTLCFTAWAPTKQDATSENLWRIMEGVRQYYSRLWQNKRDRKWVFVIGGCCDETVNTSQKTETETKTRTKIKIECKKEWVEG